MASTRDYYELLGVDRSVGPEEIRKAYRRKARQYHPDLNGGDAEATERFKEINRAYEVLSDPDKRSRYDRFGAAGVDPDAAAGSGAADFGFAGFSDIFDVFFGGAARGTAHAPGPERGDDLRADVEITLEEVLTGARRTLQVTRQEVCEECDGRGARAGARPQTCVVCTGSGYVRVQRQTLFGTMAQASTCPRCQGRGEIISDPCPHCQGRGRERRTSPLEIEIPPGAEDHTRIRHTGQGDAGPNGGPPGDLHVFISVRPHRVFRRQGRDLVTDVEVSFPRAALGGIVQIPTLDGPDSLTLPAGTQSGDVFQLSGKGLPELGRPRLRGDLHVRVRVKTPTSLNERQRRALQEFAEASGENLEHAAESSGRERGFFERVKDVLTGQSDRD